MMVSFIAPETLSLQTMLTLYSPMNPRDAAVQSPIYFKSKNDPEPSWNGPVLTIAKIIKFVMTSAA